MNKPVLKNLGIALLSLLVLFVAAKTISEFRAMKYIGAGVPISNSITVSGSGEILTTPDIATFTFSVQEEAMSVPEAQKLATTKTNNILDAIKKAGVADKDIKTLSYNIYPRYEYHQISTMPPNYGGKQVLAAYVVSQTIEVKVRKLDLAGKILSSMGSYNVTDVSGLTFSVDDQKGVERQARDKAITDARQQAEVLAQSLGVRLGRIVSFGESGNYPRPMYYGKVENMSAGMGGDGQAPQLPTGENKVTSNVTVTYEIR